MKNAISGGNRIVYPIAYSREKQASRYGFTYRKRIRIVYPIAYSREKQISRYGFTYCKRIRSYPFKYRQSIPKGRYAFLYNRLFEIYHERPVKTVVPAQKEIYKHDYFKPLALPLREITECDKLKRLTRDKTFNGIYERLYSLCVSYPAIIQLNADSKLLKRICTQIEKVAAEPVLEYPVMQSAISYFKLLERSSIAAIKQNIILTEPLNRLIYNKISDKKAEHPGREAVISVHKQLKPITPAAFTDMLKLFDITEKYASKLYGSLKQLSPVQINVLTQPVLLLSALQKELDRRSVSQTNISERAHLPEIIYTPEMLAENKPHNISASASALIPVMPVHRQLLSFADMMGFLAERMRSDAHINQAVGLERVNEFYGYSDDCNQSGDIADVKQSYKDHDGHTADLSANEIFKYFTNSNHSFLREQSRINLEEAITQLEKSLNQTSERTQNILQLEGTERSTANINDNEMTVKDSNASVIDKLIRYMVKNSRPAYNYATFIAGIIKGIQAAYCNMEQSTVKDNRTMSHMRYEIWLTLACMNATVIHAVSNLRKADKHSFTEHNQVNAEISEKDMAVYIYEKFVKNDYITAEVLLTLIELVKDSRPACNIPDTVRAESLPYSGDNTRQGIEAEKNEKHTVIDEDGIEACISPLESCIDEIEYSSLKEQKEAFMEAVGINTAKMQELIELTDILTSLYKDKKQSKSFYKDTELEKDSKDAMMDKQLKCTEKSELNAVIEKYLQNAVRIKKDTEACDALKAAEHDRKEVMRDGDNAAADKSGKDVLGYDPEKGLALSASTEINEIIVFLEQISVYAEKAGNECIKEQNELLYARLIDYIVDNIEAEILAVLHSSDINKYIGCLQAEHEDSKDAACETDNMLTDDEKNAYILVSEQAQMRKSIIKSIAFFNGKALLEAKSRDISINNEHELTLWSRFWFLYAGKETDKLILPCHDYPYGEEPIEFSGFDDLIPVNWHSVYPNELYKRIDAHPITNGANIGRHEIPLAINIMIDTINILVLMWAKFCPAFWGWTGAQAVIGITAEAYKWLTLEKSIAVMTEKDSGDHYERCYSWLRWEAEKVCLLARNDMNLRGNYYVGVLVDEMINYMCDHHFDVTPIFQDVNKMDEWRRSFDRDLQKDISWTLDKVKGIRHKFIGKEKKNNVQTEAKDIWNFY